jgi:hypothetical protein
MAGPTTIARFPWAKAVPPRSPRYAVAIVHGHLGLIQAWRLMLMCVVANAEAKEFLRLIMRGLLAVL